MRSVERSGIRKTLRSTACAVEMRPRCLAREGAPLALIPEQIGKNSGAE
jgi:hypothetical protein